MSAEGIDGIEELREVDVCSHLEAWNDFVADGRGSTEKSFSEIPVLNISIA